MKPAASSNRVEGVVLRTVYRNQQNGYNVLRLQAEDHRKMITIVGNTPQPVTDGSNIEARGRWVNDKVYGPQFKADLLNVSIPVRDRDILRFLESGSIPGVGKTYARRIIGKFGSRTFEIIDSDPDRLLEVPGIGRKKRDQIVNAMAGLKNERDVLAFLHGAGLPNSLVMRIYNEYGDQSANRIMANPYSLTSEFWGVGFKTADNIAGEVGIGPRDMRRIRAGVGYVLLEAASDGNCGLLLKDLKARAGKILDITGELIDHAIAEEISGGALIAEHQGDQETVFLAKYHALEERISQQIMSRSGMKMPWAGIDKDGHMSAEEQKSRLMLSDDQRQAVSTATSRGLVVITGGPGVGKTTIVNIIIRVFERIGVKTGLCAPTGMAAKKLSQATGREAATIHRLLGFDPMKRAFVHRKGNPLDLDALIVDESSMIDVNLMASLLAALKDRTALVLIGDVDQLPSIGPGNVLSDIIDSDRVSVVRLNHIFRQASGSNIIINAMKIRRGRMPELVNESHSDFYFISTSDPDNCRNLIRTMVVERIPDRFGLDAIRDIQVISPMRNGPVGVNSLNMMLQQHLVPDRARELVFGERRFAIGDKVMQTDNDYERDVYNGDIGYVDEVDLDRKPSSVKVRFGERLVDYPPSALGSLEKAFAITIHKSQGSEYPAVVIPMMSMHRIMLSRRLLYTAVTRGRKLVVLVGQPYAVRVAVSDLPLQEGGDSPDSRITRLGQLLT